MAEDLESSNNSPQPTKPPVFAAELKCQPTAKVGLLRRWGGERLKGSDGGREAEAGVLRRSGKILW